jgi:hypothetical protein
VHEPLFDGSPHCSRGCTAPAGRSASPPASPTAGSTAA